MNCIFESKSLLFRLLKMGKLLNSGVFALAISTGFAIRW